MKKRTFSVFLVLLLAISCLFSAGNAESKKENDGKITLKLWRAGTEQVWVDYINGYVKRFEASHPNISIDYQYMALQDLPQKLNTSFAAGIGPDIIGCSIQHVSEYASKGKLLPMDSYLEDWALKSDLLPSMLKVSELNGKHYALAYHPDPYVFAYRKDLFRAAGLDENKPPTTWEELVEIAPKLTKRDGDIVTTAGFLMPIDDFLTFVPFAVMNGASYISADSKPTFNQKPWIEALEVLTTLVKDKKVTVETTDNMEWSTSTFAKGNAAIAQVNSTMLSVFFESHPELANEVGYFELKRKTASNWNGAWLYGISTDSKHPDEAFEFISGFFESEEMWKCYEATGNLPPLVSLNDTFTAKNPELNGALFNGIKNGIGNPLVPWATMQINYIRKAMGEAFYGEKKPAVALQDNYDLLMKELKQSGMIE
jgi:ABC-type glycerol-3-phosphate transport system substrate-binding protein